MAVLLTGSSGQESTSKLIQVVGSIQFLELVGLGSLFLCWVSTGRPYHLEAPL